MKFKIFLFFLIFFLFFPFLVFAQEGGNWATDQGIGGFWSAATSGEVNQEAWWTKSMLNTINFVSGAIGGCNPEVDPECPQGMQTGINGVLASTVVAMTTTPPASSIEYLADLGKTLGIIPKTAYAQGFGESAIAPLLSLWKIFRNIAYLALVIVFVIIGFMIMFRKKLNPQTVITVQEAIPRIVVTLLLITFSYAIAGLVIDITQFATRLIGTTFAEAKLIAREDTGTIGKSSQEKLEALFNANTFALVNPLRNVDELTAAIRAPGGAGRSLLSVIIWFVFTIIIFIAMFKILFALIGPFVTLSLSIIFAPIQLLFMAIPGKSNIWSWLGGLIANAAVFPVTFTMLCLAAIFKSGPILAKPPGGVLDIFGKMLGEVEWATGPTPIGLNWAPATIGVWGGAVGQLIGFGILLTIPNITQVVKKLLEVKETGLGGLATEEIKKGFGRVKVIGGVLGS